jgi:hypothetical protein
MTAAEIFQLARNAGFPGVVAVTMTAIALRESSGNPNAYNGNAETGDRSYGLWQINMRDVNVQKLIAEKVLTNNGRFELLFDPATNAKAAFLLWGGKNSNLDLAWYITRGEYKTRYEAHLPEAQAAAIAAAG